MHAFISTRDGSELFILIDGADEAHTAPDVLARSAQRVPADPPAARRGAA